MIYDIENIIEKVRSVVKSHEIEEGKYARWIWQDENNTRKLGLEPYGCSDAANILYTIGEFPGDAISRKNWIKALQNLQNKETGLFVGQKLHPIHTTAHCIATLELFDAKPLYPLTDLLKFATKDGIINMLDNLEWIKNPWDASHQGAGIYAALVLSDSADSEWEDTYFNWLWENSDPDTGFYGKKWIKDCTAPPFYNIGSTFHYLFNVEYKHMPIRYPEKLIDSCIAMYENQDECTKGALDPANVGFSIADWVYCLTRACRKTPHRFEDVQKILREFAGKHITALNEIDEKTHDKFNDIHALFGCVSGLAELQQALPGLIKSKKPLKLVLDRRPFI